MPKENEKHRKLRRSDERRRRERPERREADKYIGEGVWMDTKALCLQNRQLTSVPEWVRTVDVDDIDLGYNHLQSIPPWLFDAKHMNFLRLDHNDLLWLPDEGPESSSETNLACLDLSHNRLSALPDWIGDVAGVFRLDLSYNLFSSVPECVCRIAGLTHLDLSGNHLQLLPETMSGLVELQSLGLESNYLVEVPAPLRNLSNLRDVRLAGNPPALERSALPDWARRIGCTFEPSTGG